jgi:dTDP-glucose 4,6-dehydratase
MLTNVSGTYLMLEATRRFAPEARFVYVSTDEVYGPVPGREQAVESRKRHTKNPYAATKAAGEHLVEAYCNTYGLKAVITRGTNTMGPMQAPEKFIPRACFSVMSGKSIPIYGDGKQTRQWLHVADHAAAIVNLATVEEDRLGFHQLRPHYFNIGASGAERTNMQIAEMIIVGLEPRWPGARITHVADRPGHDNRYAVCNQKYLRMFRSSCLQFRDVDQALWETVKWYAEKGQDFWHNELEEQTKRRGLRE